MVRVKKYLYRKKLMQYYGLFFRRASGKIPK